VDVAGRRRLEAEGKIVHSARPRGRFLPKASRRARLLSRLVCLGASGVPLR
jgi:hypothetical protein